MESPVDATMSFEIHRNKCPGEQLLEKTTTLPSSTTPHSCAWLEPGSRTVASVISKNIVDHPENAPEAFIGMLDGHNFGKTIFRVAA